MYMFIKINVKVAYRERLVSEAFGCYNYFTCTLSTCRFSHCRYFVSLDKIISASHCLSSPSV